MELYRIVLESVLWWFYPNCSCFIRSCGGLEYTCGGFWHSICKHEVKMGFKLYFKKINIVTVIIKLNEYNKCKKTSRNIY